MKILSALSVLMILCGSLLLWASVRNESLTKENKRLREEVREYSNATFYGMNKGGYSITINDDVVTVQCKTVHKFTLGVYP